ncbi:MAG: hypothetical protein DRR08_02820 [Candidatus Parabeggiatoa sp. nov. 2]|nr:MAG: hypothetical protein B6247_07250 [Beggiatoa sp. 4572_84]RKZ63673.1 MAG: hypothetical protein DRR08_02820 [Gammaproteobacteria bacterium]
MKKLVLIILALGLMSEKTLSTTQTEIELLRQAAELGYVAAQFQLGTAYYTGQGVPQDFQEAVKWYRKVAEQGFAVAQHNLGVAYSKGEGVPQNYEKAFGWYRKAAEQGDSSAQNNLGNMFRRGQGVPKDYVEAVKWYRKAAEQENAIAQYNLGVAYSRGEGVSQDDNEALKWYQQAASLGHAKAQRELDQKEIPTRLAENRPTAEPLNTGGAKKPPKTNDRVAENRPIEPPPIETIAQNKRVLEPPKTLPNLAENRPWAEPAKRHAPTPSALTEPLETEPAYAVYTEKLALSKYTITLNYARQEDKQFVNQLARYLKEKGYTVDSKGKVNIKIYKPQWDIRYYYDRDSAEELREYIRDFMLNVDGGDDIKIRVRNFSFMLGHKQIRKGRIELWILNPASAKKLIYQPETFSRLAENRPTVEVVEEYAPAPPTLTEPQEIPAYDATTKRALRKHRIALGYARRGDRPLINRLARYLKNKGYTVDKIGQVKTNKIYKPQWDIRYYYDRNAANVLKEHLNEFMQNTGAGDNIKIRVKNFSFMLGGQNKIRKGRIEVWILNP